MGSRSASDSGKNSRKRRSKPSSPKISCEPTLATEKSSEQLKLTENNLHDSTSELPESNNSDSKASKRSDRSHRKNNSDKQRYRLEAKEKRAAHRAAKAKNVTLVVLGDIGMSPRMQYHAISLASHGYNVDIISYKETLPKNELFATKNVKFHKIVSFPSFEAKDNLFAFYMYLFFKLCYQTLHLLILLMFQVKSPGFILVQNPPSIPTLLLVKATCLVRESKMIIDWHNYGFTILGMKMGNSHFLVGAAKIYENFFGSLADKNICVTDAMKDDLVNNWKIKREIITLHDKAPSHYHKLNSSDSHEFWNDLFTKSSFPNIKEEHKKALLESSNFNLLEFSQTLDSKTTKNAKPAILVSSTSWTLDENFEILIEALKNYNSRASENPGVYKDIITFVTGKGPMKEQFETTIAALDLKHVSITTAWLEPQDYPKLLGSSDIGISLHTSSSGVDLPMKVVDMLGCGLPVLACNFKCITEIINPGINGDIFDDSTELAEKLLNTLKTDISSQDILKNMQKGAESFRCVSWEQNWDEKVLNLFSSN
ncbi:hypothetical protein BB561_001961 [Smittium simulii]|uniref:Chitobiosyldiphosphodolichol beta-mannosyltransferase n=1 Tax=Smittium simulii TaxID=133385 RepID=A0A2T9YSD8_9FUNG|nr:hypothetical protein BB561_001961 [Smittium simulii]